MPFQKSFRLAAALAIALPGAAAAAGHLDPLRIGEKASCPSRIGLSTPGQVLGCWCDASAMTGSLWGTLLYTSDSSICAAARHAGAVGADGGAVLVQVRPGAASYEGTSSNGIDSSSYGAYTGSIAFLALPWGAAARDGGGGTSASLQTCPGDARGVTGTLACSCEISQIGGTVWGTGVYTDDSAICAAARHAGAIGADGGPVTLSIGGGQDSFKGSTANGITTRDYGPWGQTFSFE